MKEQLVAKKILNWYDLNKRSLPWRKNVSLRKRQYFTLVSEFMLQQTQVATVIPYFNRFIENIPDLKSLSKVQNKKLIKLWEGLGYYSRARNLKKTAQLVVKNFNENLNFKMSNMKMNIKIQYLRNSKKFQSPFWISEKKFDNYMLPSFTKKIVKYLERN